MVTACTADTYTYLLIMLALGHLLLACMWRARPGRPWRHPRPRLQRGARSSAAARSARSSSGSQCSSAGSSASSTAAPAPPAPAAPPARRPPPAQQAGAGHTADGDPIMQANAQSRQQRHKLCGQCSGLTPPLAPASVTLSQRCIYQSRGGRSMQGMQNSVNAELPAQRIKTSMHAQADRCLCRPSHRGTQQAVVIC